MADRKPTRRDVLEKSGKSAFAVGAILAGASGTSAAEETTIELDKGSEIEGELEELQTEKKMKTAIADFAPRLESQLSALGIGLDLNSTEFDTLRGFPETYEGTRTAHIVAMRDSFELHVLPQADEVVAFQKDGSTTTVISPDSYQKSSCYDWTDECVGDGCEYLAPTPECEPNADSQYSESKRCCTNSDGSLDCWTVNRYCDNSCPSCCC